MQQTAEERRNIKYVDSSAELAVRVWLDNGQAWGKRAVQVQKTKREREREGERGRGGREREREREIKEEEKEP